MPDGADQLPGGVSMQPDQVAERLQLLLHRLWTRHRGCEAMNIAAGTLTAPQLAVLAALIANGPTRVSDLAELLAVRKPSITVGAHRLMRMGLVTRSSRSSDQREIYIEITERGRRHYRAGRAARANRALDALNQLGVADREALRRALPLLEMVAQPSS